MRTELVSSAGPSAFETLKCNRNARLLWSLNDKFGRPVAAVWRANDLDLVERNIEEARLTYHISGSTRIANFNTGACCSTHVKSHSIAVTGPGTFEWKIHGEVTFAQVYFWFDSTGPKKRLEEKPVALNNVVGVRDNWLMGFFSMFLAYRPDEMQWRERFIASMEPIVLEHLEHKYGAVRGDMRFGRVGSHGGLSPQILTTVQDYMMQNMAMSISIQYLARLAGCSESHFFRAFHESTGSSPYQYLMDLRFQAARECLGNCSLSIAEIGEKVGFASAAQFSAAFSKRIGSSPTDYRSSLKALDYHDSGILAV